MNAAEISSTRQPITGSPFEAPRVTSQLLRVACGLLLLVAISSSLLAAETRSPQTQLELAKQQYLQALQKGDFTAAERHDREIKALEARAGSVLAPTVAPAAPLPAPAEFFSAPPGAPAVRPPSSSSVFTPPTLALGSTLPAAPPSSPASPAAKPNVAAPPKQSPPPTKSVSPPSILPPPPPLTRLHPHRP